MRKAEGSNRKGVGSGQRSSGTRPLMSTWCYLHTNQPNNQPTNQPTSQPYYTHRTVLCTTPHSAPTLLTSRRPNALLTAHCHHRLSAHRTASRHSLHLLLFHTLSQPRGHAQLSPTLSLQRWTASARQHSA